jgi:chemotaxis protein methyltransferase CheR
MEGPTNAVAENMHPVNDAEFALFQRLFYDRIGLHLSEHKKQLLSGRLGKRLSQLGLLNFRAYFELISSPNEQAELQTAIGLITTHETSFFREAHHFQILREQIAADGASSRGLRVWSAACSTGEEPWSIAMTLHQTLGDGADWEIVASDISAQELEKAASGLYPMERAKGIPPEYLKACCLKGTGKFEGKFLIDRALKEHVRFRQVNLMEVPSALGIFDVAFLRNVIIYFDAPTKVRVIKSVCERLRPDGWLMLGHSESLAGMDLPLRQVKPSVFRVVR